MNVHLSCSTGSELLSASKDSGGITYLSAGTVGVRDSKNPNSSALTLTPGEWNAFTTAVVDGEFNHPQL
ncbi:DUF397 domain-containing protein [Nocardia sp. XZ_19_369]|uniref:DUF397 domain-containing protein n=1 Tax=Nocardia sp. XZ_19_369 TaxID=2769487 RepID=UPI00188F6495|nr:DUF397 domain-containing protein [Nocardia sp. XZ_19_369]